MGSVVRREREAGEKERMLMVELARHRGFMEWERKMRSEVVRQGLGMAWR
jgi:hypothetical protein